MDLAAAAICVLAGLWSGLQSGLFDGAPWWPGVRAPLPLVIALTAMTAASVFYRRRWPFLLSVAAVLSWGIIGSWPALVIAQYAVGAHVRSSWLRWALTSVTVAAVSWPLWRVAGGDGSLPLSVLLCVLPVLTGLYLTSRRELVESLKERALRNEREELRPAPRRPWTYRVVGMGCSGSTSGHDCSAAR